MAATATTTGAPERGDAALRVVTDAMLWPHIISFQRGIPMWTIEYEKRYGPKHIMPLAVAEKLSADAEKQQTSTSNYYTSRENPQKSTVGGTEEATTSCSDATTTGDATKTGDTTTMGDSTATEDGTPTENTTPTEDTSTATEDGTTTENTHPDGRHNHDSRNRRRH
ncbi:hypothetical protein PINS_up020473 [Pythium insidiosum]|nr:hypothetical protein PINS_up020473 [Pythium insidiosum]